VRRRIEKSPLGSAAGYGTPGLPLDRAATARALDFGTIQEPVTACSSHAARPNPTCSSS